MEAQVNYLEQQLLAHAEFTENPEQGCPCVLHHTSTSMQGEPIRQLNEGLSVSKEELHNDATAAKRVDESGATTVEYILIAAGIALAIYVTVSGLGNNSWK
jgi:hypothetical protein